jgi:hypothetical protein
MHDVRDGAVFLDVHIESVGLVIFGDHHTGRDHATFFREVLLTKALKTFNVSRIYRTETIGIYTNRLSARIIG